MKTLNVVAAIICHKDEILCVQRPSSPLLYISKKYEFPGGKIEEGETKKEALARELIEELYITPKIDSLYFSVTHTYPDFKINIHSFICMAENKDIVLHEHIDSKWLKRNELSQLDWAAADIPIMTKLMNDE